MKYLVQAECEDIVVKLDGMTKGEMAEVMVKYQIVSPITGNPLSGQQTPTHNHNSVRRGSHLTEIFVRALQGAAKIKNRSARCLLFENNNLVRELILLIYILILIYYIINLLKGNKNI